MNLHLILKKNPYHDKAGRFTFANNANFISLWARTLSTFPELLKSVPKQAPPTESYESSPLEGTALINEEKRLFGGYGVGGKPADVYTAGVLSSYERQALSEFMSSSHYINSYAKKISSGEIDPSKVEDSDIRYKVDQVKNMDSAIEKASLPENRILWRDLSSASQFRQLLRKQIEAGSVVPGSVISTGAFMSSSIDELTARMFRPGSNGLTLKIRARKGAKALWMGGHGWGGGDEKEVVMPRQAKMLIRGINRIDDGSHRYELEVDLLG